MAGLCGLKIVLLWAGIISLTDYATQSTPPPPPQCSYTVTSIKFGLQINIISSPNGNYKININEKGRPGPGEEFNFQRSNRTSSRTIDHLKPCTEYEHNVAFIGSDGNETPCNRTEITTQTDRISPGDINVTVGAASCIPGSVCYRSHWNISSSLQTSNKNPPEECKSDRKTFCIKPDYNDICSDLTTTFTSGNCADSSFSISTNIPVDPSEIKLEPLNQLPAKINTIFPPNCDGLSVDYTCQEKEKPNESKKLSELEPFTDYSCTGQVNNNNNVATTNTTAVDVLINCDLEIKLDKGKQKITNTTIDLSWTTSSLNCRDLPTLEKLSYDCSCSPAASRWKHSDTTVSKDPAGGSCRVTGLETFTDYTCDIQPTYNNKDAGQPTQVTQKTEIGKPDDIDKLTLTPLDHNGIKVHCTPGKKFNGPERKFNVRLYDGSGTETMKKLGLKKCDFEFKDLSDSTTYTVKVTAFNGEFESNPKIETISTSYNDKAVIGVLVFIIIIIIIVAIAVGIYVLKSRKSRNVTEDVMLQTAIYVNVRPRGQHHKEAR